LHTKNKTPLPGKQLHNRAKLNLYRENHHIIKTKKVTGISACNLSYEYLIIIMPGAFSPFPKQKPA